MDDDIREGFEKFRLILSIPRSVRAVGVWPKYPYFADVLIKGISMFHCTMYTLYSYCVRERLQYIYGNSYHTLQIIQGGKVSHFSQIN